MPTEAHKRGNKKWDAAHMRVLQTKVRTEQAEKYKAAAVRAGTTVSAVMRSALDKLLEEYPETDDSSTAPATAPQTTDTDA